MSVLNMIVVVQFVRYPRICDVGISKVFFLWNCISLYYPFFFCCFFPADQLGSLFSISETLRFYPSLLQFGTSFCIISLSIIDNCSLFSFSGLLKKFSFFGFEIGR